MENTVLVIHERRSFIRTTSLGAAEEKEIHPLLVKNPFIYSTFVPQKG